MTRAVSKVHDCAYCNFSTTSVQGLKVHRGRMHPEKKKGGRPSVVNDDTLDKLETAFKAGATDKEACALAEISVEALYKLSKQESRVRTA